MPRLACATSGGRLASVRREPEIGQEEWFEMNKVFLVGRLTRDPELRTLPSGKPVANFVVATNEFRGNGAPERTEYHNLVAWDLCTGSLICVLRQPRSPNRRSPIRLTCSRGRGTSRARAACPCISN